MSDEIKKLGITMKLPSDNAEFFIPKLKAGKYYEAQKVYVEWVQELQKVFASDTMGSMDLEGLKNEKGDVDPEKLKKALAEKSSGAVEASKSMLGQVSVAASKRTTLLSICLDRKEEEILNDFYPEDLEAVVEKVLEINNFLGNLKKSVAPMVGQGQNPKEKPQNS